VLVRSRRWRQGCTLSLQLFVPSVGPSSIITTLRWFHGRSAQGPRHLCGSSKTCFTHSHAYVRAHPRTHKYTRTRTCADHPRHVSRTHTHTCARTRAHTNTHAHAHARTCTRARTHTRTHAHIHTITHVSLNTPMIKHEVTNPSDCYFGPRNPWGVN
jgi:hypothetical protein